MGRDQSERGGAELMGAAFPIPLSSGQVSSVDTMSEAPPEVTNWQVDASGINRPRPSLVTYSTTGLGTSPLIGLHVWRTWVIGVTQDRKIWALLESAPTVWIALTDTTDATTTTNTSLDGGTRPIFAEDGLRVVIAGGGAIQVWTGAGYSARLGGGPLATHIASLGSRFIGDNLAFPQEWDWSNLGDGAHATWSALDFTTADARPDNVVAIHENLREAFVFGETTTQVYSVSADPFSPFSNVVSANVGTTAPYSIIRMDESFAFLDDKRRFVLSDGRGVQVLSDAISKDLRALTTVSDCWGYREDLQNYTNIVWTYPTAGRTFVYDTDRKAWGERKYYSAGFQVAMPQGCYVYWPALNLHLLGSTTTGALYQLDADTRSDLTGTLLCDRTSGIHDMGTGKRKRDQRLLLTIRRGTVGLGEVDSQMEVRVRDDQGAWSDWDTTDLGEPSDAEQTVQLRIGGVFRRRQYQFRYSGTHEISLISAVQEFQELAS